MSETFYHGLILGLCAMLDNQYHAEMIAQGVKEILQYGIAFYEKSASVKAEVRKS